MASLAENTARTITAFDDIKTAVTQNGVAVEDGTPVEQYPNKISEVYAAGEKAEYDKFWDVFQNNGKRTSYLYAFSQNWNDEIFKPKYDIKATSNTNYMFYESKITNLKKDLEDAGVKLVMDSDMNRTFYNSEVTVIPEIKVKRYMDYTFFLCEDLKSIEKLVLNSGGVATSFSQTFAGCRALKDIVIGGEISNDFEIYYSPLTKDSILGKTATDEQIEAGENLITVGGVSYYGGVIGALSPTTTDKKVSLNKTAVNNGFGINVEDETTYTEEWNEILSQKSNWTFAYYNG